VAQDLIIDGDRVLYKEVFQVKGGDFAAAGEVSGLIKQKLKKIGLSNAVVRKISIASYEAELNIVIHSYGGQMTLIIEPDEIVLLCEDTGPGIPDIDLAMREGYSTASESIQMMGFGAGMGLPNIRKNSDEMSIQSDKNGTRIELKFKMK